MITSHMSCKDNMSSRNSEERGLVMEDHGDGKVNQLLIFFYCGKIQITAFTILIFKCTAW